MDTPAGRAAREACAPAESRLDMVYFDIDDTLYDQAEPFAYAVRRTCGDVPGASADALYDASRHHSEPIFAAFSAGRVPTTEEYALRMQQTLADFGISISYETACEAQRVYADESGVAMSLSPSMASCLDVCLRRSRLGVGIITNGKVRLQKSKLEILGTSRWVRDENVFISQEVGLAKPDPAFFRFACERSGTVPARCVYVGDAWGTDVVGARSAEMPVVWMNRRHRVRPEGSDVSPTWEVRSEKELLALLESDGFWMPHEDE